MYVAGVHVEEAQQHLRQRRLAGPGGADHGDPAALLQRQVEPGECVPVLPGVPGGQPLYDEREGCRGCLAGPLRFPYGLGGVQYLVHALGALADPLPVLHGEGQSEDGLEGGERGEDDDGRENTAEPSRGDGLGCDEGGGGDGQARDQRGEAVAEGGGGGGSGGDPGEDAIGSLGLRRTGGQRAG